MSLRVIYEEKAIDQAAEFSPMIPPVSVHYWIPSTGWPVNLARPIRYRTVTGFATAAGRPVPGDL